MLRKKKRLLPEDFGFTRSEVIGPGKPLEPIERVIEKVKKQSVFALELVTEAGLVVPREKPFDASAHPVKKDVPLKY